MKAANGPRGATIAWCPSEAHFIFLSAASARKQSRVTELMLITPESPPFSQTKAAAGLCGRPLATPPVMPRSIPTGLAIVLLLCRRLTAFRVRPESQNSSKFNINPQTGVRYLDAGPTREKRSRLRSLAWRLSSCRSSIF